MDNLFMEFQITDWLKFRFNGGIDIVCNEYKSMMAVKQIHVIAILKHVPKILCG